MLWFGLVFQGAMLLLSPFSPTNEMLSSLPPCQQGTLSERNTNIFLAWLLLKLYQINFSEELGGWILCSAVYLGRLKHWAVVYLICEQSFKWAIKSADVHLTETNPWFCGCWGWETVLSFLTWGRERLSHISALSGQGGIRIGAAVHILGEFSGVMSLLSYALFIKAL